MTKLMAAVFALVLAGTVFGSESVLTATTKFVEKDNRLWCYVAVTGTESGQKVEPVIKWTAPESAPLFCSSEYKSPRVRSHTRAYRTLVTEIDGISHRAIGTWKVEVVVDGMVITESTYEVK
jgi:hypothetical protein